MVYFKVPPTIDDDRSLDLSDFDINTPVDLDGDDTNKLFNSQVMRGADTTFSAHLESLIAEMQKDIDESPLKSYDWTPTVKSTPENAFCFTPNSKDANQLAAADEVVRNQAMYFEWCKKFGKTVSDDRFLIFVASLKDMEAEAAANGVEME